MMIYRRAFSMKIAQLIILSFALLTVWHPSARAADKETAFDRVIRTGVLRCGFWNWAPLYEVDPNSGATSGIFKDLMEEFSRISEIKVEWASEVHFSDLVTDLNSGKIDAVCAGTWSSAARAKFIRFSRPVFFIPMNAYVREGDTRFDHAPEKIDDPGVKVVAMDGEMSTEIRKTDFPKSSIQSIPQLAGSGTELLMNVVTGKGDVTFTDAVNGAEFMAANPGKVRPVPFSPPLRLMPNTIAVPGDEERLQDFIDVSLQQLENSGVIEKILKRYDARYPGVLVRTASPQATAAP